MNSMYNFKHSVKNPLLTNDLKDFLSSWNSFEKVTCPWAEGVRPYITSCGMKKKLVKIQLMILAHQVSCSSNSSKALFLMPFVVNIVRLCHSLVLVWRNPCLWSNQKTDCTLFFYCLLSNRIIILGLSGL